MKDLADQYVALKVAKFKAKDTLLWRKFAQLSNDIIKLLPSAQICYDDSRDFFCQEKPYLSNDLQAIFAGNNSEILIKICLLKSFKLDFSKCPLQFYLVCGLVSENESKILKQMIGSNACDLVCLNTNDWCVLVNLSDWIIKDSNLESWQQMWAVQRLLYPTSFTHDLAFTFTNEVSLVQLKPVVKTQELKNFRESTFLRTSLQ